MYVLLPELRMDAKATEDEKKAAREVAVLLRHAKRSAPEQQTVQNYFRGRINRLHLAERDAVGAAERERRGTITSRCPNAWSACGPGRSGPSGCCRAAIGWTRAARS